MSDRTDTWISRTKDHVITIFTAGISELVRQLVRLFF